MAAEVPPASADDSPAMAAAATAATRASPTAEKIDICSSSEEKPRSPAIVTANNNALRRQFAKCQHLFSRASAVLAETIDLCRSDSEDEQPTADARLIDLTGEEDAAEHMMSKPPTPPPGS